MCDFFCDCCCCCLVGVRSVSFSFFTFLSVVVVVRCRRRRYFLSTFLAPSFALVRLIVLVGGGVGVDNAKICRKYFSPTYTQHAHVCSICVCLVCVLI